MFKNPNSQSASLSSQCRCHNWTIDGHCNHSAALFLHYKISRFNQEQSGNKDYLKSHLTFHGSSVHVDNYGRLEKGANKLIGSNPNSTYSSLQYLLTNRKFKNFPFPQEFKSKLIINLVDADDLPEYEFFNNLSLKYFPIFSYVNHDGVEIKKISLFESLYIFDWTTGEAFNTPTNISHVLKKLLNIGLLGEVNDLLKICNTLIGSTNTIIKIKDIEFNNIETLNTFVRYSITPAKRKGFLDLSLELFDKKERLITPPTIFKTLVGEGGFLNSFRTKNDSYEFLKILIESLRYDNAEFKKFAYSSSQRSQLIEWIEFFQNHDEIIFYEENHKILYLFPTDLFKEILLGVFECFTETAARFSFYSKENKNIYYQLPKSYLFNGIATFYKRMQKYNIPIFYNNVEIKTWSSNIRFERKKSNLDWFEVNLVVDEHDLQIIKNADIGEEYIVSNNQLVLLEGKEKELLKFMKKYTKHEAYSSQVDQKQRSKVFIKF